MRRLLYCLIVVCSLITTVNAMDFEAPDAPPAAEKYMPVATDSFWDDLKYVIGSAMKELRPNITAAVKTCVGVVAIVLIVSVLQIFPGTGKNVAGLVCTLTIGTLLLQSTNTLIGLGVTTVHNIVDYGKLLLPVMTAALAAQGGVTTSAAIYSGTTILVSVLSAAVSGVLVPLLYVFLCICIANSAVKDGTLKRVHEFMKWLFTWIFKMILYVFTGYMGITGVISGATDAAAMKVAKLTISGVVPVVGSIMSDASETILVSAELLKNSAGIYGLITMIALLAAPFLKIGVHYLVLKITMIICSTFSDKSTSDLIGDFSTGMGFLLAMTGTVSLLLMVSVICFMKGVS